MNKELETILKKMCSIVNATYDTIDFKKAKWFHQYEWTLKQENKFKEWMVKLLDSNLKVRNSIMQYPQKNKKNIQRVVNEFIFNYGWKTKTKK